MVEGISLHEGGEMMGVLTRCPNLFTKKNMYKPSYFFLLHCELCEFLCIDTVYQHVYWCNKKCAYVSPIYIYTYGVDIYIYVPEDLAIIYVYIYIFIYMSYIYGVYMPHSFVCTSPLPFPPRDVPSHVCPRIHGYHWLPKSFEVGAGWCQLEPIRF